MTAIKRFITLFLAVAVTATALAMASASAWNRAETGLDRWLMVILSCLVVACVHLLPALMRGWLQVLGWPIWAACLVAALWGHQHFFSKAATDAALTAREVFEARELNSPAALAQAKANEQRKAAIEAALKRNYARSVGTVSRLLAQPGQTHEALVALRLELESAQRAERLREELANLAIPSVPLEERGKHGAGTQQEWSLADMMNFGLAGLLELLGVFLWMLALAERRQGGKKGQESSEIESPAPAPAPTDFERLTRGIQQGETSTRVADIKRFMACGTQRAMELRRQLIAGGLAG